MPTVPLHREVDAPLTGVRVDLGLGGLHAGAGERGGAELVTGDDGVVPVFLLEHDVLGRIVLIGGRRRTAPVGTVTVVPVLLPCYERRSRHCRRPRRCARGGGRGRGPGGGAAGCCAVARFGDAGGRAGRGL